MKYYKLSSSNMDEDILLMHERVDGKYPSLRKQFEPFCCPECEIATKDTYEILEEVGIPGDVTIPLQRDFMRSFCRQYIVSQKFKSFIEGFEGAEALFLPIPGNSDYFIFYPIRMIEFPEDMPTTEWTIKPPKKNVYFAYAAEHECSICTDRPVHSWMGFFSPPKDFILGGIKGVGIGPIHYNVFVNEELAVALKKAKFTGLIMSDGYFKS